MVGAMWSGKTKIEDQQNMMVLINIRKFNHVTLMIGERKIRGNVTDG
jgi:hypothetical protein